MKKLLLIGALTITHQLTLHGQQVDSLATNFSDSTKGAIGFYETDAVIDGNSIVAISSENFQKGMISSPEQLIAGKLLGVQVTSSSGSPGDAIQLRIRGLNSIHSSPLFVVDGIPLTGGKTPSASNVGYGSSSQTNPLNFLNPSDIEKITVLKDGSTSLYGVRGSNGVVLIETKKGTDEPCFLYESKLSYSTPRNHYDLLNSEEFLAGIAAYSSSDPSSFDFRHTVAYPENSGTNWQDYISRSPLSHRQALNYSRASEAGAVFASGSIENQLGIIRHSNMARYTGRINASKILLDDRLVLHLNSSVSSVQRTDPPVTGNSGYQGDLLGAAYSANPTWPSDPAFNTGGQRNPANMLRNFKSTGQTSRALMNFSADYEVLESLSVRTTYGLDFADSENITLLSGAAINAADNVYQSGLGYVTEADNKNSLFELSLTYKRNFGLADVDISTGYSFQKFQNEDRYFNARGFGSYDNFKRMESDFLNSIEAGQKAASNNAANYNNWGVSDYLNSSEPSGGFVSGIGAELYQKYYPRPSGVSVTAITGNYYETEDYLQSFYARGNFEILKKYAIGTIVRIDGSSRFDPKHRYGVFPMGSLNWNLHREDFIPDLFSTMKIRASFGVSGNFDAIGHGEHKRKDRWSDVYVNSNLSITPSGTIASTVNPNLKWETTRHSNVGLDFGIRNEKFIGSVDFYEKETANPILEYYSTFNKVKTNIKGTIENIGWELYLKYRMVETERAFLNIAINVSQNKNLIKDFSGMMPSGAVPGIATGESVQIFENGFPLFAFSLPEFAGFDQNGQPMLGNRITSKKSAIPKWNYGLSLDGGYKKFDFAAYFLGQGGAYVYNVTRNAFFTAGSLANARNVTTDVPLSKESPTAQAPASTRFLEKADFFRLQTLCVGYEIPFKAGPIHQLRIDLTGQNILLITKYSGLDPEVSTSPAKYDLLNSVPVAGIDYTSYPRPRIVTLGAEILF